MAAVTSATVSTATPIRNFRKTPPSKGPDVLSAPQRADNVTLTHQTPRVTEVAVSRPRGGAMLARMQPRDGLELPAPEFPREIDWLGAAFLRMDRQMGRHAVLVEFWDFCRVNSLRTLPYVRAWHERYAEAGLRVIGVHAPGYSFGRDRDAVARAVDRLEVRSRSRSTPTSQSGAHTTTAAGPGATCSTAAGSHLLPLRRGRLPGHRARDPGHAARDRSRPVAPRAARAAAAGGRARRAARAPDRRHRAAGRPRPARAGARLDRRRGLDRGRRRRGVGDRALPRRRRVGGAVGRGASSRGSTRRTARSSPTRPGSRLHGFQFEPLPRSSARGGRRGGRVLSLCGDSTA